MEFLQGTATYMVTGDEHLLSVGNYQGISIITPAVFVTLLEMGNA